MLKFLFSRLSFFLMMALLTLKAGADEINLPSMGDPSGALISPEEERRLGEAMMRSIRQSVLFVDDPEVNDYVQSIGYKLVSNSDNPSQRFTFFVISDPMINAFALPGGFVGLNSGLVLATESESELASVLAHEIAHVTQRHMARAYEAFDKLSLPMIAGMVAAILIGTQNSEAGAAALAATQAAGVQTQLDFTRSNEAEADNIGIKALASSGYDPRGMPAFFSRMQQATRYYGNLLPDFLRTHPVTSSRVAESLARAEQYPYKQITDSMEYYLTRMRLKVLEAKDPNNLVREIKTLISKGQYRNREAAEYGYALALLKSGEPQTARPIIIKLLQAEPNRIAYRIALARIETEAGDINKARKIYENALNLYPGNRAVTMYYANMLLVSDQPARAKKLIDPHLRNNPTDLYAYKLLSRAEKELGNSAASHLAMAEYYYLNGQIDAAIQQLNLARTVKNTDFYLSTRIDARLKDFQDELALQHKAADSQ